MGLRAGVAAENAGGDFWSDGFWKGAIAGFASGAAGFVSGGAAVQAMGVQGIIPGALVGGATGAATGGLTGGMTSWAMGNDFWDGAQQGAMIGGVTGMIGGGYQGFLNAKNNGLNYWWGSEVAYNRDEWSLAWWDKPDVVRFDYEQAVSEGQDCMVLQALELESKAGGTRNRGFFINELGTDLDVGTKIKRNEYSQIFHNLGFPNDKITYSKLFKYDNILKISKNNQLISVHYPLGEIYHTSLISKIKFYPNDKVIIIPGHGSSFNLMKSLKKYGKSINFYKFF
jgi:hypothetical protein